MNAHYTTRIPNVEQVSWVISENRETPKRGHANETSLQQFPPSLFLNINAQCGVLHSHNFKIRRSKNHENKKAVASEYSSPLSLPSPPPPIHPVCLTGKLRKEPSWKHRFPQTSLFATGGAAGAGDGHPSLNETRSRLRYEMFLGRRSRHCLSTLLDRFREPSSSGGLQ